MSKFIVLHRRPLAQKESNLLIVNPEEIVYVEYVPTDKGARIYFKTGEWASYIQDTMGEILEKLEAGNE